MVVKIRLARFGPARKPVYNIVVAQARSARGSKPMEVLGTYDPVARVPLALHDDEISSLSASTTSSSSSSSSSSPSSTAITTGVDPGAAAIHQQQKKYKDIKLDTSRTKYWLGVGAQPSEPVERLLCMIGLLEPKPGKGKPVARNVGI